ncbi:hypothetical protein [Shewanella pneumatophori]|uniref:Uncharacterized protein n=1 Tax=Shewanella pneumatophori TaxID=314092 RepID=A0A9X1ZCA3_9GAMM|nr:hypothetical protein [Shewanella pneumatophori]MCL1137655.1 hypothetical protein [Shewanella pneumatophori]
MLDAICLFDELNPKTYSVFKFQKLSEIDIERFRQALVCPACQGKAYYRKASKDGKAACFGSRYHQADCIEFKPSAAKAREGLHAIEVNQLIVDSDAMMIDFSRASRLKPRNKQALVNSKPEVKNKPEPVIAPKADAKTELETAISAAGMIPNKGAIEIDVDSQPLTSEKRVANTGLEKILSSLMRGSELATSDLWVYTDSKYRWRAKNLFVNFADAEPTEKGAPRMYWGTISHTDKDALWLNPADSKDVGIPIDGFAEQLKRRFGLTERRDFEGAGIILLGKCFWNKAKNRKIIQLWNKDLNRMFISKVEDNE